VAEFESEEKYPERFPNSFCIVSGASRLRRRPALFSCSNLFASSRPWRARASKGERAGGTSPARGLGRSPMDNWLPLREVSYVWERNSRPPGRSGRLTMAPAALLWCGERRCSRVSSRRIVVRRRNVDRETAVGRNEGQDSQWKSHVGRFRGDRRTTMVCRHARGSETARNRGKSRQLCGRVVAVS
jgi:hypothetical protein